MPTPSRQEHLTRLHAALEYKRLSRAWAKVEILFGLLATGIGLLLGTWAVSRGPDVEWAFAGAGLGLFTLGGYLALAGHRSHRYQSNNELAAYLVEELPRPIDQGGGEP
jgi:hypothetical protein